MSEAETKARSAADLTKEGTFLVDEYMNWVNEQRIPVHEDFGLDLLAIKTDTWDWYGAKGCFAHTHGRGDFMTNYVIEIPPGSKTRPVKHLYEFFVYVLAGQGSCTIWLPNGEKQSFEWGPQALFAIPLNCQYQFFNASGSQSVRLSCTSDAPLTLNPYHNRDFFFNNPFQFPDRFGKPTEWQGEGRHVAVDRGPIANLNLWETNFIPNLSDFKLFDLAARGKGST